jgi:flagellar hook-length control protein FliK
MGHLLKEISDKIKGQTKAQEPIGFELNIKKQEMALGRIETAASIRQDRNLTPTLPRIIDRMIFMVRGGIQRSRLVIHPPELGRLDLDLSIKHGHLQAHLSAESTVVKELIEANLNNLRQQLSDQGLVVDKFEVMLGLNDQKSADNRNGMSDEKRFSRSVRGGRIPLLSATDDEEKGDSLITDTYQIDVRA